LNESFKIYFCGLIQRHFLKKLRRHEARSFPQRVRSIGVFEQHFQCTTGKVKIALSIKEGSDPVLRLRLYGLAIFAEEL
jgi:hypothetical protein